MTTGEERPASVSRDIDTILSALRRSIQNRGFTQQEVQTALGWGRTYISQLFRKQKILRVEQVLSILHVIGVRPRTFFAEIYGPLPTVESETNPAETEPVRPEPAESIQAPDPPCLVPGPPHSPDTPPEPGHPCQVFLERIVAEVLEKRLAEDR